jgi:hypothetical protein
VRAQAAGGGDKDADSRGPGLGRKSFSRRIKPRSLDHNPALFLFVRMKGKGIPDG